MSINQKNTIEIKSLNGDNIKLVKDLIISEVTSNQLVALNSMNTICKSNLKDKLKKNFFITIVESVRVYDSNTWN